MHLPNILILSSASKVALVNAFTEALVDNDGKLFVSDLDPDCTTTFFSDGFIDLPSSDLENFSEVLLEKCIDANIGLVIPTRDGELQPLAKSKSLFKFHGIEILVPEPSSLEKCQDKLKFGLTIEKLGFNAIKTYKLNYLRDEDFPLFLKPRIGAAGHGTRLIKNKKQISESEFSSDMYILQQNIKLPEFSIDALFDLDSNPIQAVLRTRENIVNGESQKTQIIEAPEITGQCLELGSKLGLIGHNVFQVFWDGERSPIFIEVNPRFGGASNASIVAGLSSPKKIVDLVFGSDSQKEKARNLSSINFSLIMQRYSCDYFYSKS